jgi:hypothetical protein
MLPPMKLYSMAATLVSIPSMRPVAQTTASLAPVALIEAFNHFFFHYTATPLLVVETSQIDLSWPDAALDDLLRQIQGMTRGTRYYVPRP